MSELDDLLDPEVTQNGAVGSAAQATIPNAGGILALGIISIVGCFLYAIPGLVCGIIAIALHSKAKKIYLTNPAKYQTSYGNAKAGYICGIIGTSLSALYIFFLLYIFIFAISTASAFRV